MCVCIETNSRCLFRAAVVFRHLNTGWELSIQTLEPPRLHFKFITTAHATTQTLILRGLSSEKKHYLAPCTWFESRRIGAARCAAVESCYSAKAHGPPFSGSVYDTALLSLSKHRDVSLEEADKIGSSTGCSAALLQRADVERFICQNPCNTLIESLETLFSGYHEGRTVLFFDTPKKPNSLSLSYSAAVHTLVSVRRANCCMLLSENEALKQCTERKFLQDCNQKYI